ncbi:hypothetical protein [Megasphaera sp.]|uniref:hypothetical protein n=1 Tax=Megasphaera sp. TaxID=2023260 RepID=UPI00351FAE37
MIFSFAKKRCLLWQRFFYKAPFIGELAAEGGLRGCFLFSERFFFYFRKTASNLSVSVIPRIQAGRLATAVRFGNRLAPLAGRHLTGQKGLGRPLQWRTATCVLLNISRKTAGFVEYIIYILIYHSFFILDKGGIPYEEEYYLSNGRGGFGLRAGLGL